MKFRDLEKSIVQMFKENPWLAEIGDCSPPRGYDGLYLDFDEKTGEYLYPQTKKERYRANQPRRYNSFGEEQSNFDIEQT